MLHPMPFRLFSFSMLIAAGAVLGHFYLFCTGAWCGTRCAAARTA